PPPTLATSPTLVPRSRSSVARPVTLPRRSCVVPLISTLDAASVSVPVLSLLFSDSRIDVMVRLTVEPAGITTRPDPSRTSLATLAWMVCPCLWVLDEISELTVAFTSVPDGSVRAAGAGAGVDVDGREVLGREGAGRDVDGVSVAAGGVASAAG